MHRMLKIEWAAVAGVLAAVTAIVLHFLHVIETEVLSVIQGRIHPRNGASGECG